MNNKSENQAESKSFSQIVRDAFKELGQTLAAFAKAPRALWGINVPYILEGLSYFGILTILGKFCSENVMLSDPQSGWVYGGVTGGITFAMLLLGGIVDKIGVRTSLALSLAAMAIGRFIISLSGSLSLATGMGSPMFFIMIIGLLLMVAAYGLFQPAAYAGVKSYTNPQTAAMGYAVLYALMNLGAFISGYVANITRTSFAHIFPPNGLTAVFWSFSLITVISFLFTILILTKKVNRQAIERVSAETAGMSGISTPVAKQSAPARPTVRINNTMLIIYAALALGFLIVMLTTAIKGMDRPVLKIISI
ncbi:MAG: MFS transporter, partial [Calditrichaeota bacterium]